FKKVFACAAVTALSSLGVVAPVADASHSWNNYHWARTSNPFTVKLGDNVDSRWDSYLATSSTDWSKSTVLDTVIVAGGTTGKRCAATLGRVEVCNAAYGQRGWLGLASINISGSHITQGTVKLNDTYFDTAKYNTPAWRNLVMCQEVGHDFGLDHQDEDFNNADLGTCMDYSNNPEPNQHPNAHDYDMLESIYSHTDSTSTVSAQTAGNSAAARTGNSPKAWGHRVDGSRSQGASTYVKDLGGGNKTVTHVIWAR
nr:hypothetical protein [Nocardioidaceae bacterium]